MKRIIKGKQYNTETAKRCGKYEPNPYQSDLSWFCETLYQKKNGEFFLHGYGRNELTSGEEIIPMTYAEAQEWAEKHMTGDEYNAIFGDVSEDESRVSLNLSMTAAEADIIRRNAAKEGMTVSAYIVHMCAE